MRALSISPSTKHVFGTTELTPAEKATAPGYDFKGWYLLNPNDVDAVLDSEGNVTEYTMPGRNLVLQGEFVAKNSPYKVEFYKEKDGEFVLEDTDTSRSGTTDTRAEVTAQDRAKYNSEGYYFDTANTDNVLSGTITGYGEATGEGEQLTLKLYFKPRTDTKYKVEYYYQQGGQYPSDPDGSVERQGTTDTTAKVTDADKTPSDDMKPADTDYAFDSAAASVLEGNIEGDGSLVLKVYFKQQFKVTYKDGADGTVFVV